MLIRAAIFLKGAHVLQQHRRVRGQIPVDDLQNADEIQVPFARGTLMQHRGQFHQVHAGILQVGVPGFSGSDENVSVEHVGGKNNKIEVTFNPGKTRADLVLGTFRVDWKGNSKLESGIYKAEVMVSYSTL